MRIGKGGGAGCRMGLVGEVGSALKVAPFGKRRNAAPSLVHQTRNPRSDSAAALRRTCAARATTPADGATARLLPSYLTQLPPRPCHSLASSISTSGRPTTCDDRRRRRRRPSPPASQPAAYRSRYRHACPLARGPLFRRHIPGHHHLPDKPIPTSNTEHHIVHTRLDHHHQFTSRQPSN